MAKITITIDGDKVTINQSVAPTKVEQKNKKFFIIMREEKYDRTSWVEFVSDDYSKIVKLTEISIMDRYSNGSYIIKDRIIDSYIVSELISKEDKEEVTEEIVVEKKQISLSEIDDKLSNIDSIIKDINE